ncbi:MAG: hypothetical protein A3G34_06310 [Candidatus Lindowbacteria bacterium RIFCSPLOWO2_12_FULL_62_27]|nr:MAG: hypothetical protein A3G34_06310 [Candidatus Lindowbacteria bacterium RIFCSPLOWO2_12_FULL_62_27]
MRIQRWIERAYLALFERRWRVAGLSAVLCLAALTGLARLRVNNTMDVWFSDETPSYARYRAFTRMFGSDEYLFITLDMGDVFDRSNLEKLEWLTLALRDLPGVVEVMALPTAADVRGDTDGGIYVDEVRGRFQTEPAATLRARILADERFVQTLVSRDGRVAAILMRFESPKIGEGLVAPVEGILKSADVPYYLGGYIFAQREMDRLTFRDYFLFGTICLVILTAVFWILFRDAFLTAIFVGDCVLTVGVVLGCMGHMGVPIHLMTGILPPLLMAMAIADDIHLIERFLRIDPAGSIEARVARSSSEVAIPSFLSGLTTFAGFFSLSGGEVPAIGHFGFWSGIGILFTYAFSFLTVPVLLTMRPAAVWRRHERPARPGWFSEQKLVDFCGRRRWWLVAVFAGLSFISFAGIQRIVIDTQLTNFFEPDSDFMRSMDFIERRFGNTGPVEIVLTSDAADGLKSPEFLSKADDLIARLGRIPRIETVLSINPVLKTVTRALYENRPEAYRLPDRRDLLEQELLVLSLSASGEEALNRYVNPSWTQFRIQARLPRMSNNEALEVFDKIESEVREVFGAGQGFYLSGVVEAYSRLDRFILESQLRSLAITLAVVTLVFWLQVGRPLWAVLALLPNLFPIVLMFATMGLFGITLNVATATVAAITLGLADDDTVFFFYAYLRRRRAGQTAGEALAPALDECRRAIWLATLLNVIGFSIFIFSSFRPTVYFGVLTSEVWALALLAELFLLPTFLVMLDRKFAGPTP